MSKEIYVNSYTRADGTEVSGYYRTVPDGDNENFEDPDLLQGGISKDVNVEDNDTSTKNFENLINIIKNNPKGAITDMVLNLLDIFQELEVKREKFILDEMMKAPSNKIYKILYNKYINLMNNNQKNVTILNRLKYEKKHYAYQDITKDLQVYESNYNKTVKRNTKQYPLSHPENNIVKRALAFPITPLPKAFIDIGMYGYNKTYNIPDAKEMWKAASHDFRQSHEYVSKNGALVGSISDLPPNQDFQKIVQAKVYQQLGQKDSMGVIFKSDSDISREVAISPEIKQHFLENKDILLNKKVVKNKSTYFKSSKNLSLSIGHGDIVYSYLDNKGNLVSLLLDTYDMNKDDTNRLVQIAYRAQKWGTTRTYYSIFVTKTPKYILNDWLKNSK